MTCYGKKEVLLSILHFHPFLRFFGLSSSLSLEGDLFRCLSCDRTFMALTLIISEKLIIYALSTPQPMKESSLMKVKKSIHLCL